uniref:DNA_mis_repair domain-containing protein n=1 Tax=Trichuris muris TaxID=70415 RepID=A0A5S6QA50_TRIMR
MHCNHWYFKIHYRVAWSKRGRRPRNPGSGKASAKRTIDYMASAIARPILRLDKAVVDRIAAGEVVLSPANAVKELVENSIDAGASQVSVCIADSGLKLVKVQDNGCGIRRDDLPLSCERFATSKLRRFEDLLNICTLGFRGEALASMAHVARVTVRSRTADSPLGYECHFTASKMDGTPKPLACNPGTVISLEDLFYNCPVRLSAVRNSSEAWKHCFECVQKFSIHFPAVGFTFKREEKLVSDLKTKAGSTVVDNVAACFCPEVARGVVEVECEDTKFGFKANGVASTTSYTGRTSLIFFFINNRLVQCDALKRSIRLLYSNYFPKHREPFVYLSLQISPHQVDVNLHPTKQQVGFLYEKEIFEVILSTLDTMLKNSTLGASVIGSNPVVQEQALKCHPPKQQKRMEESKAKRVENSRMVRVDHNERKMEEFAEHNKSKWPSEQLNVRLPDTHVYSNDSLVPTEYGTSTNLSRTTTQADTCKEKSAHKSPLLFHGRRILLTAVHDLKQEIGSQSSASLRALFREHSYVGSVDPKFTLLQYKTGLYMINIEKLSEELFYQLMIMKFGNHEAFRFSAPCNVKEMLELAVKGRCQNSTPGIVQYRTFDLAELDCAVRTLSRWANMLWDYFSIEIVDGQLVSIPKLLDNYLPTLDNVPNYLLNLVERVDWSEEKNCYRTISRETSKLYAFRWNYEKGNEYKAEQPSSTMPKHPEDWRWTVKQLCKAFRSSFLPPEEFENDGSIVKLTDVSDLYKVFERC